MIRKYRIIIVGLLIVLLLGSSVFLYKKAINPSQIEIEEVVVKNNSSSPVSITRVVVHVDGLVKKPGVYTLNHGDRILDAIDGAGGVCEGADISSLNLAEKIKDGQKIVVSKKLKVIVGFKAKKNSGNRISLNSASQKQLESLPGVGLATAKRIIAARPYSKLEDLMRVNRIGKKSFNKLKEKIRL